MHPRVDASGVLCVNPTCPSPQNSVGERQCGSCGAELWLQGRYQAVRSLGQGGAGRTFLALDQVQQPPCFCVIQQRWHPPFPLKESQDWLGQIGAHPQIPAYLNHFEQGACFYLVQEYIRGSNLATRLWERGSFSPPEIWAVLQGLLPVLRLIHATGVIHRDIKPVNILLRGPDLVPGNLVLVDMGAMQLAALCSLEPETAVGSPEYAAPEQLAGRAVFASDLYSLGVTCLHLLTGVRPFNLFGLANGQWVWRDYCAPDLLRQHGNLAQVLDQLVEPALHQRVTSVDTAIMLVRQTGRQKIEVVHPPGPAWHCSGTLVGHQGLFAGVNQVAISMNNQTIASASEDQTVRLWNGQTGAEIVVLRGHEKAVKAVVFHPHATSVLVSGGRDRQIHIWDSREGLIARTLAGHQQSVNALAFAPSGTWLASGSADKTIKLWDWDTGNLVTTLTGHSLAVNAITVSPVAPILVSASVDSTVKVWDLESGSLRHTLGKHTASVRAIAFSPDGQLLATAGDDRTIHLWDTASWSLRSTLSGHPWSISALGFSPDGTVLFSSSWDKTVKGWNVATGKEIAVLAGHTDSIDCLAIASDGRAIVTGSQDKTVRLWRQAAP